uniref:Uncharacterized protein n=1 Tax=Palpitomonas bilix TaxID=652834 RepID=A0A7S3LW56_9EUKA|mmetsp:Transcript_6039/g.14672  ORF Transcript_6039/g.14672 Transcript_6039/m.14672 type:complete len:450 (+) Transcript_6039:186-1535(+)
MHHTPNWAMGGQPQPRPPFTPGDTSSPRAKAARIGSTSPSLNGVRTPYLYKKSLATKLEMSPDPPEYAVRVESKQFDNDFSKSLMRTEVDTLRRRGEALSRALDIEKLRADHNSGRWHEAKHKLLERVFAAERGLILARALHGWRMAVRSTTVEKGRPAASQTRGGTGSGKEVDREFTAATTAEADAATIGERSQATFTTISSMPIVGHASVKVNSTAVGTELTTQWRPPEGLVEAVQAKTFYGWKSLVAQKRAVVRAINSTARSGARANALVSFAVWRERVDAMKEKKVQGRQVRQAQDEAKAAREEVQKLKRADGLVQGRLESKGAECASLQRQVRLLEEDLRREKEKRKDAMASEQEALALLRSMERKASMSPAGKKRSDSMHSEGRSSPLQSSSSPTCKLTLCPMPAPSTITTTTTTTTLPPFLLKGCARCTFEGVARISAFASR